MVGRPRRASTSSVDTVDDDRVSWRQEKSVLRYEPGAIDPEKCFELRDAVVLNKDGHTLENALDVATRGPYTVRGTLVIDPDQKHHLITRVGSSTPLEVKKCSMYWIGENAQGAPIIWVQGTCAFYEITPSPAYAPMYKKMREAVLLYYRLLDIYTEKQPGKAKKSKKDIEKELYNVFHQYATHIGDGSTLTAVKERCDEHASFLISQCLQDLNEVHWPTTPFFKWLIDRHPEIYNKEVDRLSKPAKPRRSPSVEARDSQASQILPSRTRNGSLAPSTVRSNATPEIFQLEDSPPRQRASRSRSTTHRLEDDIIDLASSTQLSRDASAVPRPISVQSSASTPSVAPLGSEASGLANGEDETPFQSLLNALERVREEISSKPSKTGLSESGVINKLYFDYKFPNYRSSQPASHRIPIKEILHYNARALLQVIDKEKYNSPEPGFYSWLEEVSQKPFDPVALKPTDFPFHVVPRKRSAKPLQPAPSLPALIQQTEVTPMNLDDDFSSPTYSSPAGKRLRRPGRPSGVKSSLRLATASKKRHHSDVDSESEDEETEPKKSHYFSGEDDVMEKDDHQSLSGDEASSGTSGEPIKIFLRADNIPTTVPRGPDETWVCEEEDCGFVVRGGDIRDCRSRIRSHFNEHEQQMDRVNLAMAEASRGDVNLKYAYFPPFLILVELHTPYAPAIPRSPVPVREEAGTAASTPTMANSPVAMHISLPQTPTPSPKKTSSPVTKQNFRSMVDGFRRRPHPVSDNIDRLTL
ncbi:uncharacterized protein FTOL_10616 [Fusarium torulosum]|uniref:DNA (cytosine-5)-methyltransferase 1 replication foci domain-containing protein n=1 Tax=Fusarium torulosum TaxID=33205 RepID=A0AAE8SM68_9HYPO|nr:uncharacterized protein FTOL_10616 [Fusarium torulosum]